MGVEVLDKEAEMKQQAVDLPLESIYGAAAVSLQHSLAGFA